jgi:hypothetical protein
MEFTRSGQILEFKFEFENEFDWRLTGQATCMACYHWTVPIQLRAFNLCHRMQIQWTETEGERGSPGKLGFGSPAVRCGLGSE